ncbi:hypothetical protein HZA45_01630 [Candidatus Peregrinibacteria bacterium]|nr:hypothetical protein [Candidatus Peregrinibacteria bacterium]
MSAAPSDNGEPSMDDLLLQYGGPPKQLEKIRSLLARVGITTRQELQADLELYESRWGLGRKPDFSGGVTMWEQLAADLQVMKTMFPSHEVAPYKEEE